MLVTLRFSSSVLTTSILSGKSQFLSQICAPIICFVRFPGILGAVKVKRSLSGHISFGPRWEPVNASLPVSKQVIEAKLFD